MKVLINLTRFLKSNYSTKVAEKKICVIGSGPAGFYFTQHLFKGVENVVVDMYEKLPVPFGLVRYGVAPDHPEVKNVINTFTKTASHPGYRFIGNVNLGEDVSFSELANSYHAIVLAYGCSEDNQLNIPGEDLSNVVSARKFVGWYNGLPSERELKIDLNSETVVILGQGNVAIDVARILLTPLDILKRTDITNYALQALSNSKVKTVYLVGRRGPLQAAFTIKEFRELTKLPNLQIQFRKDQLNSLEPELEKMARPRKRLTELILKTASAEQSGSRFFKPLFFLKPVSLDGSEKVTAVNFAVNTVDKNGVVHTTNETERLECGMVFRSIGYKGSCPDNKIPFDDKSGRVLPCSGIYGCGWINKGPVGVILTTMNDAFEQADNLSKDLKCNVINTDPKPGYDAISEILKKKGKTIVNFDGWNKIDEEEIREGKKLGKPREKIVDIKKMLSIGGKSL